MEYLGITYASAERWQAPVPVPASDKVYEAFKYGPCCLQNNELKFSPFKDFPQSEDCLTLNVIRPAKLPNEKKLPVLVNFHGGDFCYGGSASPLEDGANFVREHQDIIYVNFNYRLETLGFMDFSKTKCDAVLNFKDGCKGASEVERNVEAAEYYFFREPAVELAKKQLAAGGKVRLSFWDAASPVERFGASGYAATCLFLGNLETAYQLGSLKNAIFSKVMQKLLANFVICGDPSIKTNTIKNVKGISWPYCTNDKLQYLHITEKQAVMSEAIIPKCEEMHRLKLMT